MTEEEKLLKVPVVAERLGLGVARTWELVASGELPSLKIGRSRRVPASAVDAYIKAGVEANDRQIAAATQQPGGAPPTP
jgi:excisionase family DNA binding protein